MLKSLRDKLTLSGIAVLMVGVGLLIFAFISAYGFLTQSLSIIASEDLARTFGEALAPLIATSIRIMYLGVMVWIGSLLTLRGLAIVLNVPRTEAVAPQKSTAPQEKLSIQRAEAEKPQKEAKIEPKPSEPSGPEIVVIPEAPESKNADSSSQ
jgi:hypothetical protein